MKTLLITGASKGIDSMPSARTRILGTQLYKFGIEGFLHWGYNFYFAGRSRKFINPFMVTDAAGAFPSGDPFILYPSKDLIQRK